MRSCICSLAIVCITHIASTLNSTYHSNPQPEEGIRDSSVIGFQTCFFFFQAEDGIRDSSVTGVQTCALPISDILSADPGRRTQLLEDAGLAGDLAQSAFLGEVDIRLGRLLWEDQIGRASCRERV